MRRKVKTFPRENVLDNQPCVPYSGGRNSAYASAAASTSNTPTMPVAISSTNPRKIRVSILNPTPGGNRYTSLRNAQRFVRRGVARWSGERLEFITSDANNRKVIAEEIKRLRTGMGYDRVQRAMTLEEIAAIPVVCPQKLLIDRGRRKSARN